MAPRMAPITNSKTHPRIVVTDKCCIVCNRSWSAKIPSGRRTHPRSQPPGIFSSGVGVDVPVVQFGRGRAPSGDDGHVAVDVDDHLVDLDGWKRIVPQVLDVSLLGPHLPVAPSRYEKDGERFGWQELLPDLPQPELRGLVDSLHLQIAFQPAEHAVNVEVTLAADEPPDPDNRVSEVWSVPR